MSVELDNRLKMLAALTPACHMAADVGADHGFLGAWLLQSGQCERVQFLDISASSLQKARRLIREQGLEERALFSVGDGLEALMEPAQSVVIAGMGGPTIAGIVERGREALRGARLVMQPNVGVEELRGRLAEMGFRIVDEALARAGYRWYVGIAAEEGSAGYTAEELLVGPVLMKRRPANLSGFADFRIKVLTKAHDGAVRGSKDWMTEELERELRIWKEVRSWL